MKNKSFIFYTLVLLLAFGTTNPIDKNITPKKGIDIKKAMEYPIPEVIARYKKDYGVSDETAKIHERELKRFLIISAENHPKGTDMFSSEIDDLWHTFLLFTKDYEKYCKEILGGFIHHVPKNHEKPNPQQ